MTCYVAAIKVDKPFDIPAITLYGHYSLQNDKDASSPTVVLYMMKKRVFSSLKSSLCQSEKLQHCENVQLTCYVVAIKVDKPFDIPAITV